MIHPDIRALARPIDSFILDPQNARKHGARNYSVVKASFLKFGQRIPIVVEAGTNIIRAGNLRWIVAKDLGWTEIAAVMVDEVGNDGVTFGITDNKSSELAEWDFETLGSILADMPEVDLSLTGFDDHEIDMILKAEWDNEEKKPLEDYLNDGGKRKPHIEFQSSILDEIKLLFDQARSFGISGTDQEIVLLALQRLIEQTRIAHESGSPTGL
jgi:hypothetical protein